MTNLEILSGGRIHGQLHFGTGPAKAPAHVSGLVNRRCLTGDGLFSMCSHLILKLELAEWGGGTLRFCENNLQRICQPNQ